MWGMTYFTSDYNEMIMAQNSRKFKIVIIDDDRSKYEILDPSTGQYKLPNDVSFMSVLLPPFEAVSNYIDGDLIKARSLYEAYLNEDYVVAQCMSAILAALFYGKNVLFFIPYDEEMSFEFGSVLFGYMNTAYGLSIGNIRVMESGAPYPNPIQLATIMCLMYDMGNITFEEFVINFPDGIPPMNSTCQNIINASGIDEIYIKAFLNINQNCVLMQNDIYKFVLMYMNGIKKSLMEHTTSKETGVAPILELGE